VQHLRSLMESRPYLGRIPDQGMLLSDLGSGGEHVQATRDQDGRYAFVYLPTSRAATVRLGALQGERVTASWYDPRSGQYSPIGEFKAQSSQAFTPLAEGPDWVLALDAV
jgi:hypothetical protein